ncbi:hypothetical protein LCGC14_0622870 [marine sediment metagenome]|uniref:Hint domain-containing protein n=1 Tax=marine sediment metagenome TaxID=412755 RepID=A0A0F9TQU1_9ZZZZ
MKQCKKCGRIIGKNKHECKFNTHLINTKKSQAKAKATIKKKYHDKGIFFGFKKRENHSGWTGDKVGYMGVHNYIRKNKVKPICCEKCEKKTKLELSNISGEYKRDINDFFWLCRGCHQEIDRTRHKFKGEKIKSIKIEKCGEKFYDIETETENFIANNIVSHNSRPSKKSISCGVYMPSIVRESVEIVVSLDTSGSVSKEALTEFMTEINGIAKSFNNLNMKLIVCDYDIKDVYEIGNGADDEITKLILRGGGGTSHIPVYEYIKQNLPNTQFLINFTDGYTEYPDEEEVKTLWVLNEGGCEDDNLKWGEIIRLG